MELSINVHNLFSRYDFETCAKLYRNAGFRCIDYSLEQMVKDDDIFNSSSWRDRAESIRHTCDELGLRINQTHAPFSFKGWDDETRFREVILPRLHRAIEISGIFGAEVCVIHPLHHYVYRGHEQEIFERNMEFYRGLIPVCRENGVMTGIENMFQADALRHFRVHDTCSTPEEFVRYIDTLNSEYMVACLDVGHVSLPASDVCAADVVRALGHDRLKALHIHDNDFCSDQHQMPFIGKLDWAGITRALGEIDYSGVFTYEIKGTTVITAPDDFVPIGLEYMHRVGSYLVDRVDAARPAK